MQYTLLYWVSKLSVTSWGKSSIYFEYNDHYILFQTIKICQKFFWTSHILFSVDLDYADLILRETTQPWTKLNKVTTFKEFIQLKLLVTHSLWQGWTINAKSDFQETTCEQSKFTKYPEIKEPTTTNHKEHLQKRNWNNFSMIDDNDDWPLYIIQAPGTHHHHKNCFGLNW